MTRRFEALCESILNEIQHAGGWFAWHNEKLVVDIVCDSNTEDGKSAYASLKNTYGKDFNYEIDLSRPDEEPVILTSIHYPISKKEDAKKIKDLYSMAHKDSVKYGNLKDETGRIRRHREVKPGFESVFAQKVDINVLSSYDEYPDVVLKMPKIAGFDFKKVDEQAAFVKSIMDVKNLTWQEREYKLDNTLEIKFKYAYPIQHDIIGKTKEDLKIELQKTIDGILEEVEKKFGEENYVEAIEINEMPIDEYMVMESALSNLVEKLLMTEGKSKFIKKVQATAKKGIFPENFFVMKDEEDSDDYAKRVARGAKSRSKDAGQAIKRLNYYKVRGGKNLTKKIVSGIEKAIKILQEK